MIISLKINSQQLLKFLKGFKLSPLLYCRIKKNKLKVLNIDYKDYSGVLEGVLELEEEIPQVDFSIDSTLFLNKLELFKEKIQLQINLIEATLILRSLEKKSYTYKIECDVSRNVSNNLNLKIVEQSSPRLSFKISAQAFLNSLKAVTIVDNIVFLKFLKEGQKVQTILTSSKTHNISQDLFDEGLIQDLKYHTEEPIVQTEIYYNTLIFNNFFKQNSTLKVSVLDSFMVLEGMEDPKTKLPELTLYIPLRDTEQEES